MSNYIKCLFRINILVGVAIILLLSGSANATTLTVNASGGENYTKIQEAIDNASVGDTILVYSGTYYENVNVNQQLTLRGIGMPVVDAGGNGSAIGLSASAVIINGFAITGSGSYPEAGIKIYSNNNTLSDNLAFDNGYDGIRLQNSRDNNLINNTVNNNSNFGIFLEYADNNSIINNSVFKTRYQAIILDNSSNNRLTNNNVSDNNYPGYSIIFDSENNTLIGNIACSNNGGFYIEANNNTLLDNLAFNNNYYGIFLSQSNNHTLRGNNASNNDGEGLVLYDSSNNTLRDNIASYNMAYGIDLERNSRNNSIHNNLFNNTNNLIFFFTNATNYWNTTKTPGTNIIGGSNLGGNVWANPSGTGFSQTCTDGNSDGICDLAYALDGNNTDYLPLAYNNSLPPPGDSGGSGAVEIRGAVAQGPFLWDAYNFPALFYEFNEDVKTETLNISYINGRLIAPGQLIYSTRPEEVSFTYSQFGKYQIIGFLGQKYFAGYTKNATPPNPRPTTTFEGKNTVGKGQLHKILIDDNTVRTISVGNTIALHEGYALKVKDIDLNARMMNLSLLKEGTEVDVVHLGADQTYVYSKSVGSVDDLPLILFRFDNVFAGQELQVAFLKGLFQISETPTTVNLSDVYGNMTINTVNNDSIIMDNDLNIELIRNKIVDLTGSIKLRISDEYNLRFYPYIEYTTPGTYEVRGTVANATALGTTGTVSWTSANFSGFWYNLNNNQSTEMLTVQSFRDARTIDQYQLWYNTTIAPTQFKVASEKNRNVEYGLDLTGTTINSIGAQYYDIVGWMGEKYVGINGKNNKLAKLILEQDTWNKKTLTVGEKWDMGGNYTLIAQAIDARAYPRLAWFVLSKDGVVLDDQVIEAATSDSSASGTTQGVYTYYADIGGESNVPIFVTYLDSVFSGATSDMVQLKYTWLIDNSITKVNTGDMIGIFNVESENPLTLKSDSVVNLSKNSTITLAGNMKFRVSDSDDVRFYPKIDSVIPEAAIIPNSLNISINNGAPFTGSTSVTLSLSAINATQMSFSNDGLKWSPWESFVTAKSWVLISGDGLKIVSLKVRNSAGETSVVSDIITLHTGKPTVTNLTTSPPTPLINQSVNISFRVNDNISLARVNISITHPSKLTETFQINCFYSSESLNSLTLLETASTPGGGSGGGSGGSGRGGVGGFTGGELYLNFSNTTEYGRYDITILASDRAGNTNNTEKTWFVTTKTSNKSIILNISEGETANGSWIWNSTNFPDFVHNEYLNVTVFANRSIPIEGLTYKISREIITKDTGVASRNLTTYENWSMGAGYELTIDQLDANTNLIWFTLWKDGAYVDAYPLEEGVYYVCDSCHLEDKLLFIIADNIFHNTSIDSDMVQLRFGLLTSDNVVVIQAGQKFENLTVNRTSLDGLTLDKYSTLTQNLYLTNENAPINLTQASSVKLLGSLYFNVENTENLSYYPYFKEVNTIDVMLDHNLSVDVSVNGSISSSINFTEMASVSPGMNPDLLGFNSMNKFIEINASNELRDHLEWVIIKIFYTPEELGSISEETIKLLWYNETSNVWENIPEQGVVTANTANYAGYVWAKLNHLSTFTLAGRFPSTECTSNCGGGNGGSGGGGGGGGSSGENYTNIEAVEKYDLQISKDALTSYRFTHAKNPIMFVNITGNTSLGMITASIEVLKNTSTLVKTAPEGLVYKNTNIWVGTSGYATPKNIKQAIITFRVDNEWMSSNGVSGSDIALVKWDGSEWITLETSESSKDDSYTYFEAKTQTFSPFAIISLKGEKSARVYAAVMTETPAKQTSTPTAIPTKGMPGFEIVTAITAIYMLSRRRK